MRKTLIIIGTLLIVNSLVLGACAPTSKPPSPAAPTPIPTTPPSVPEVLVEATDVTFLPREWGDGYFLGFVKNVSNSPVGGVTLTLTIYDKAAVLIAQEKRPIFTSLRPGERYPFQIYLSSQQLESYDRYEIAFETYRYYKGDERLCPELKVTSDHWEGEGRITGILQNTTQKTAEAVGIRVAGYDDEGKLIAVDSQMGGATTIPPGMSAAFEVNLLSGEPSKVTNYEFFISARLED